MKATLGLEQLGVSLTPEVSEVYRDASRVLRHSRLIGKRDYRYANKRGTSGIYLWFLLEQGRLYCVREMISWTEYRTYHATAQDGKVVKLSDEEVKAWLSAV